MKKNRDYFGMLQEMSSMNTQIAQTLLDGNSANVHKPAFFELQSEFLESLLDAFVAPIERSDLYVLSRCLENELNALLSFSLVLQFSGQKVFREAFYPTAGLCRENTKVIAELKNFRSPKRVLSVVRENKHSAGTLSSMCSRMLLSAGLGKEKAGDLLFSEGIRAIAQTIRAISEIDTEMERIIINNN